MAFENQNSILGNAIKKCKYWIVSTIFLFNSATNKEFYMLMLIIIKII